MIQNPILKVLSIFRRSGVKALLIGGQASIIYGAVEFSRDTDFIVLLETKNIERLRNALGILKAKQVFFPPLDIRYLQKGHACHFRCNLKEVSGLRVDIMAKLQGCDTFYKLWGRRKIVKADNGMSINLISLEDLVQCKKTQRDKDWFMLKRLVDIDILKHNFMADGKKIKWWFQECVNPELLIKLAEKHSEIKKRCAIKRPLLKYAEKKDIEKLNYFLNEEEQKLREKDKIYWMPLRKELEQMRRKK